MDDADCFSFPIMPGFIRVLLLVGRGDSQHADIQLIFFLFHEISKPPALVYACTALLNWILHGFA